MLGCGRLQPDDVGRQGCLAQPFRHQAPQHAAFLAKRPCTAFSGDHQHTSMAIAPALLDELIKAGMGLGLPGAMKIQPGVDPNPAARQMSFEFGRQSARRR